jgi:hypothetical protein
VCLPSFCPPVLKNQPNSSTQAGAALFNIAALAIGAWDFRGPRDEPLAISFDDRC